MKIQIKHRSTLEVLFETQAESMKDAVQKALKNKANLSGSDLSHSNLSGSDLSGSDLSHSNLSGSDLRYSDLLGSNLRYSDLSHSNLIGSDLRGSNLRFAKWDETKKDMFSKLSLMPDEVLYLYKEIHDGRIEGSVYEGECACFCGTLANAKRVNVGKIPIKKDSSSPMERFFLGIQKGDTPETNPLSKLASEWIEEFCKEKQIKIPTRKVVWE